MTFCPPLILAYFASEPEAFLPPPVILWPWLILVAAFGACVGSFLNVVIYRVPEGRSIVTPPSSCPKCGHRLAAYDNVPIFGWLWLGGKCRYCKTAISIQYPIIEALTALFFGGLFFCYYVSPLWPAWSQAGLAETWPALVVHLVLIGALVASTVIDFRLYIIALPIPWTVTVLALIALPVASAFLPGMETVCPLADGRWLAAAGGGAVGLIVSCALLYLGVLPRSFDEDPEAHDELGTKADAEAVAPLVVAPVVDAPVVVDTPAMAVTQPSETTPPADAPAPPPTPETPAIDPESFLAYPHPRREIAKEIVFLALPILGAALAYQFIPVHAALYTLPVRVFGGVLLGYLAGGGMIWITRILGTLGFDKEAMGLGDVHLLGAIGAVLGWQAAGIVFFIAPFLGLGSYAAVALVTKLAKGSVRVIPYGPYLAAATLFFMACHGTVMDLLNRLLSNGAGK